MPDLKYMVLAGATGVGKSELACEIACRLRTEVIGADAFQIYQGLDILTGKPTSCQLQTVRHHLVSHLPLTETFDAYRYAALARQIIITLNQSGLVPLVVGGTGFYLHAFDRSLPSLPPASQGLRTELELRSAPDLLDELSFRDPVAFGRIDRQNRRRVIRALEVCIVSGRPFSSFDTDSLPDPAVPRIFLERSRATLNEQIERRIAQMFAHGVVEEVAGIKAISKTASKAIGFSLIRSFLAGQIDENTCRELICQQTRQYAKRQMTWFRRQPYEFVAAESSVDYMIAIFRDRFSEFASC
jgi:tRNA dimethylallyltransferase